MLGTANHMLDEITVGLSRQLRITTEMRPIRNTEVVGRYAGALQLLPHGAQLLLGVGPEVAVEHGRGSSGGTDCLQKLAGRGGEHAVCLPGATDPESVRRALRPVEHDLLTEVVRLIARGAVRPDPAHPRRIRVSSGADGGDGPAG